MDLQAEPTGSLINPDNWKFHQFIVIHKSGPATEWQFFGIFPQIRGLATH